MKSTKRGLAVLLAALLAMPVMPVWAAEGQSDVGLGYEETAPEMPGSIADGLITAAQDEGVLPETTEAETSEAVMTAQDEVDSGLPNGTVGGGDTVETIPEGAVAPGENQVAAPEGTAVPGENQVAAPEGTTVPGEDQVTEPEGTPVPGEDQVTEPEGTPVPGEDQVTEPERTPAPGDDQETVPEVGKEYIRFNTGHKDEFVVNPSVSENEEYEGAVGVFGEDGSYTIQIPEKDPFFPYEVEFSDGKYNWGERMWFETPDSTVEYGGHVFRVAADFSGTVVTQLSFNVAGDRIQLYPEEKYFDNISPRSLLPLEEVRLKRIDLEGYTPLELTMVSVEAFMGNEKLADPSRIIWSTRYLNVPDYQVIQEGDLVNLAYAHNIEMIVGEADQLAADNIRYIADIGKSDTSEWLVPVFYTQDEEGRRTQVEVKEQEYWGSSESHHGSRYEFGREYISLSRKQGDIQEGYLGLSIAWESYEKTKFTNVRAFEGWHESAAEAMAAEEVTGQIFTQDMGLANAGYKMKRYADHDITLVSFDAQGNITGCLPVEIYYSYARQGVEVGYDMYNSSGEYVTSHRSWGRNEGKCEYMTYYLRVGNPVNGIYSQKFSYLNDGETDNSLVTAAYAGLYSSIAEAMGAGAADVKGLMFGDEGYPADYSQGVFFSIFVGEDGAENQEVYQYHIETKENDSLDGNTTVNFYGVSDPAGKSVSTFAIEDSYGENNFIVFLVDEEINRGNLALRFSASDTVKLYAEGSSTAEVSGKSYHDFSGKAMHFTSSAEDGEHAQNYWVYVVSRKAVEGQIFMNSLIDESIDTRTENGIVYTSREMMLDNMYDYRHDIMLANMGGLPIENLSAELVSDVVELDDYWTLTGNHGLSGFTTVERETAYGKLSNLALLRFRKKEDVADGTDVTGTLTIKSGETALMVVSLTGTVGDPSITTKEVPQAVKYVPYGTMIQNSNKYSWNTVTYRLLGGELPEGMSIKPNGELYGVPTEVGEFTFTVRMTNSYTDFGASEKEFTLVVNENTDENVEGQTDLGYILTDRVAYEYDSSMGDQLVVSQGVYGEFVDLWLDGVKLERGVDYTAESGSTRIVARGAVLAADGEEKTHTIGFEFRTADTDTLKKAAQNYVFRKSRPSNGNNGSDVTEKPDTSEGSNSSGSNTNQGSQSSDQTVAVENTSSTIAYTVQFGDTLSKIAQRFYGSSRSWRRIYTDNAKTIRNPNRIYPGQVLIITLDQNNSTSPEAAAKANTSNTARNDSYIVVSGDNLYKIAQKVYGQGGRWNEIYQANKNIIANPGRIYAGQVLIIP